MIKEIFLAYALQDAFCVEAIEKLSKYKIKDNLEQRIVCSMIIDEAREQGIRPIRALSVAWEESRFTFQQNLTGSSCIGPLQIKPVYWCPEKGQKDCSKISNKKRKARCMANNCDTIKHGVKALKTMIEKFKPIRKAYCYYNDSRKPECKTNYMSDYVEGVVKNYMKIKPVTLKDKYKSLTIF